MSQVVSGVTQRLKDLLPNQIGDNLRWTDADVERYIMVADRLVRERIEITYREQEIMLEADTIEYTLDSEFIDIVSVELSTDGSTYDDYLKPLTLDDLDKINLKWREDGGAEPDAFCVISAPGLPTATLLLYRKMSAVDGQKIKVIGHSTGVSTTDTPNDVLDNCHVPFVMAMLMLHEQPQKAAEWYGKYLEGCDVARRRYRNRMQQGTSRVEFGW